MIRIVGRSLRGVPHVLILLAACSHPRVVAVPPTAVTLPRAVNDSAAGLRSTGFDIYQPGNISYDYRLTSTVQVTVGDSVPRTDSTRIMAILTALYSGNQPITVAVRADSIRLFSGTGQPGPVQTQFATSQLDRRSGRLLTRATAPLDCTLTTVDLTFRGDEVTPAIPEAGLTIGAWTDSSSYDLCRGGVRLLVNRKTRYHVDGATEISGQQRIVRSTELRLTGSGTQWQQPVQVMGSGSVIDTLVVAGSPARIQTISGVGRATFEFTSALRRQTFVQSTTISISSRNR